MGEVQSSHVGPAITLLPCNAGRHFAGGAGLSPSRGAGCDRTGYQLWLLPIPGHIRHRPASAAGRNSAFHPQKTLATQFDRMPSGKGPNRFSPSLPPKTRGFTQEPDPAGDRDETDLRIPARHVLCRGNVTPRYRFRSLHYIESKNKEEDTVSPALGHTARAAALKQIGSRIKRKTAWIAIK